jgi:hypothetical protein
VVLVRTDGLAAALLEESAASLLAADSPRAPAVQAAERIGPENVLWAAASEQELLERVSATTAEQFLVVSARGEAAGVLDRRALAGAFDEARARGGEAPPILGG